MTNNFTPAKAGQQSKRLSKEEYAEKMKAEKEAVYQMADDTAKAIVSDPEKFKAFLDTQSRLDRYSAVNALLIFKQLPEASQLKNFDDWSKDNVKIQKGAKSISIPESPVISRSFITRSFISAFGTFCNSSPNATLSYTVIYLNNA